MRDRVIAAVGDVYELGTELGRGGMAIVYRATDLRLRRDVAIKVLPPELAFRAEVRSRFLREAETAAQLSHPNIVPIYSVDERDGLVYFVMALVDGESLGSRLQRGPLRVEDARRVLRDVADALSYAHAHGVIHRDIKPDNVILDRDGSRAMVTDFGIARAVESDSHLTATGIAVGTPAYMSPEQALGEREVDGRSDIYSLGVVAYQLLSGELPFKASNTPAMMMKHVSETPRPLVELRPDVPRALAATVDRAMAKRPEDRWPDAGALRDALAYDESASWRHEAVHAPGSSSRGSPPSRPAENVGRRWQQPLPPLHVPPTLPPTTRLPPQPPSTRDERARRHGRRRDSMESFAARPIEERIVVFRRNLASTGATVVTLAGINFLTSPHFPWFLFAALGMGTAVARQWSTLWAEGVTWRRIFNRDPQTIPAGVPGGVGAGSYSPRPLEPVSPSAADQAAARLAPPDVLAGPHGAAVKRAATDRETILGIVRSLAKPDRDMLPDVLPTVDALAARGASLAQMLHHLDADVSPDTLAQLQKRIAQVKLEPESSADHSRRLSLLERQYASLGELTERRARLYGQLESVGFAMQNLKLDLLKLRSSGLQAALGEVNSATVEARALSRDIDHVLQAVDEVRRM